MKNIYLTISIICLTLLTMISCAQKEDSTKIEKQPPSKITGDKQLDIALAKLKISPLIYKKKAINFDTKDLNGQSFNLKKQQGKIVFINFWATWCPPCVYEMPSMEKLHKQMPKKDFLMVAVSIDDNKKVIQDFVKKHKLTFTIVHDVGKKILQLYNTLGVYGFPTTFIIDKQGFIIAKVDGEREWYNQASLNLFNTLITNKNNK